MKLKRMILFATLTLVAMLGVPPLHADDDVVELANIPFDFYAGTQKMPAGAYRLALNLENDMITISDSAGQHTRFLRGIPLDSGVNQWAVVFDRRGDSYFLKDFKSDVLDMSFPVNEAEHAILPNMASIQVVVSAKHS